MDSTVDMMIPSSALSASTIHAVDKAVHLMRPVLSSREITICRLGSGNYAISAHEGDRYIILDVTPEELRAWIASVEALAGNAT